jgi:hypothetical protein
MISKGKFMGHAVEKRKFNRYEFQKPVLVFPVLPSKSGNILEVEDHSLKSQASDISEGGLRLATSNGFKTDSILKLNFKVEKNQPVEVYGKIIWKQKEQCGVRFVLVDPQIRKGIRAIGKKKSKSK